MYRMIITRIMDGTIQNARYVVRIKDRLKKGARHVLSDHVALTVVVYLRYWILYVGQIKIGI